MRTFILLFLLTASASAASTVDGKTCLGTGDRRTDAGLPAAPTTASVTPGSGPLAGGTEGTISRTNPSAAAGVMCGDVAATALTVSPSSVTCLTPAAGAGVVDVMLSAPGGAATSAFSYASVPAPVVTGILTAGGTVGQAFFYQITASHVPTSFAATGLPAGLAIDWATGAISGMADAGGIWPVTIAAANAGGIGSATLVLTIAADQGTSAYSSNDWSGGGCGSGGGLAVLAILALGIGVRLGCQTAVSTTGRMDA